MAEMGVQDDDGTFVRPDKDDIVDRKESLAEEHFGVDVDLSQGSPIKQIIDVTVEEHHHIWQALEETYYSAYFEHAYENQLDKLLGIASITRRPRRGATGVVTFAVNTANERDVVIAAGTRVATEETEERPSIPFKTEEPATLEAGRRTVTDVPIRAVEPWETDIDEAWLGAETNVAANTITVFETPVSMVDDVYNPYPTGRASRDEGYSFIEGRDRETDHELRERFRRKYGESAHATLDGIRANLLSEVGVLNVEMEENVTMDNNTGNGGLPPKSFRATILGDAPDGVIAQSIFDKRPAGIESYGEAAGAAQTEDGEEFTERWDWAEEAHIYLDVSVTHTSDYPSDGNLLVENRVIEKIGGETLAGDQYTGLGMGSTVVYDTIHSEVMDINGVWRVDIEMGTDPDNLSSDDVSVGENETAMTAPDSVNVFNTHEERD